MSKYTIVLKITAISHTIRVRYNKIIAPIYYIDFKQANYLKRNNFALIYRIFKKNVFFNKLFSYSYWSITKKVINFSKN